MSVRRLLILLVAINAALFAGGWLFVPAPAPKAGAGVRVGIVFDVGGKNDKSFNEQAYNGLRLAERELGVVGTFIEPTEGVPRETALRALAARTGDDKLDLVVGVGWVFSSDLERLAQLFPDVNFAGVDYAPSSGAGTLPNLVGLRFREHEGSFLVGAAAGLATHTKVVGFVGGMQIPLIKKFEVGYRAGVAHVCPDCRVLAAYAGSDPRAFSNPPLGQQLAGAMYDDDADIIYHASGKTGDGVFAAARRRGQRAIGVDSDQFAIAPCCVMTSMVKRVDLAIVDLVREVIAKKFRGGMRELGLAEQRVGFVADEHNRLLLPPAVVNKVRALSDEIIAGKIQVPWQ
ncbi:MAG: BMP family ABC transporter substrate-binding protein [Deltaproteobacteria bacterium]|nr:BMP family ABC transporter substrate-binding protein [Deltaproteobacteria bacterium]